MHAVAHNTQHTTYPQTRWSSTASGWRARPSSALTSRGAPCKTHTAVCLASGRVGILPSGWEGRGGCTAALKGLQQTPHGLHQAASGRRLCACPAARRPCLPGSPLQPQSVPDSLVSSPCVPAPPAASRPAQDHHRPQARAGPDRRLRPHGQTGDRPLDPPEPPRAAARAPARHSRSPRLATQPARAP